MPLPEMDLAGPDGHLDSALFNFVKPGVSQAEVDRRLGEPFIAGESVVTAGEIDLFPYSIPTGPSTEGPPVESVEVGVYEYRAKEFSSERALIVFREGEVWYALLPPQDGERTREEVFRLHGAPPVEERLNLRSADVLWVLVVLKYPARGLGFVEKPGRGIENRLVFSPEANVRPAAPPSAKSSSGGESFDFSSGGASHLSGYGEWKVRLTATGELSIAHDLRGKVTDYGTFALSPDESSALWDLVQAADLESRTSSTRRPVPDEVSYTFGRTSGRRAYAIVLLANDVREIPSIAALLDELQSAIARRTGQEAVL